MSKSKATSLRIYNNHDKYSEWVFIATQMSVRLVVRPENRLLAVAVVSHSVRDRREARDVAGEASLTGAADSVSLPRGVAQALVATPAASVDPVWVSRFVPATGASSARG